MKVKKCKSCGKEFIKPGRTKAKYCNAKCFNKIQIERLIKRNKSAKFREMNCGENHHNWKGGKVLTVRGYYRIKVYNHPRSMPKKNGYIYEHRLVMEKHLGRYLKPHEVIHHINGIKTDNRLKNLILIKQSEHRKLHC